MTPPTVALCYHRVLDSFGDAARGWPYFARGTAVSLETFVAQMRALAARFDVVLPDPGAPRRWTSARGRPCCWLTFDDGYREVYDVVRTVLADLGMRATVFVTTCTLQTPPVPLPADRWFAALTSAARRRGELRIGDHRWHFDLEDASDRARFIDGPERRAFLRANAETQADVLARLAEALDARATPSEETYLTPSQVRELVGQGWSVGAHGASHAIFDTLDEDSIARELAAIDDTFRRHEFPPPTTFAWPDGAASDRARAILAARGYTVLAALGSSVVTEASDDDVPRYIVPDDPRWVERTLAPLVLG